MTQFSSDCSRDIQDRDRGAAHAALKAKLRRAAAQAESGELVDGEEFMKKLIDRLGKRPNKPDAE